MSEKYVQLFFVIKYLEYFRAVFLKIYTCFGIAKKKKKTLKCNYLLLFLTQRQLFMYIFIYSRFKLLKHNQIVVFRI